jgi:hypothetical protein
MSFAVIIFPDSMQNVKLFSLRRSIVRLSAAMLIVTGVVVVHPWSAPSAEAAIGGAPADSLAEYFLTKISTGNNLWCAVNDQDAVQCAVRQNHSSNNQYGQVGNGSTDSVVADQPYAVAGAGSSDVQQVAVGNVHACLLKNDGTVWCWGAQYDGSAYLVRPVPEQVMAAGGGALNGVIRIDTGDTMNCAVKGDGTVWCWGSNIGGLGVDSVTTRYRGDAVQVQGVSNARSVTVGRDSACAVLADSSVMCWGTHSARQLGRPGEFLELSDGRQLSQNFNRPAQHVLEENGSPLTGVRSVAGKLQTYCALTDQQQVRCWGSNMFGVLNSTTEPVLHYPAPPIVFPDGALITSVALSYADATAVAADGTGYRWGGSSSNIVKPLVWSIFGRPNARTLAIAASGTTLNMSCRVLDDSGQIIVACPNQVINASGSGLNFVDFPMPSPPVITDLTVGATSATVTLSATPGATPTEFQVTASAQAPATGVVTVTCGVAALCVVTPLTSGVTYTLEARAANANGISTPTTWDNGATFTVGPVAIPEPPVIVIGAESIVVTPQATTSGGTPNGYIVYVSELPDRPMRSCTVSQPATSCSLPGLTNGAEYTVTTSAVNEAGESEATEPVTVVVGPTAPPLVPTVNIGDRQATITVNPSPTISADTLAGTPSIFTVTAQPGGHTCTVTPPATSCVLSGLTNGEEYTFTTTATNDAGTSSPSPSVIEIVDVLPAPPSAPTVIIAAGGVTLSSTPDLSAGSVQAVTISAVPSNPLLFCSFVPPVTSCFIEGLTAGTLYTFEAVAGNTTGTASATTQARFAVPATPTISTITINNTGGGGDSGVMTVTVSADTGTSGGPASTIEIHISPVPNGATVPCVRTLPNSACTFTGLTPNAVYTVTTSAVNELGPSIPSGTVEIPLTAPLAPNEPVVTIGDRQVTVTIDPTTSGAPASSYTVTASATGQPPVTCTVTPPATNCVLSGLTNGLEYTITTSATNAFGTSDPSEPLTVLVDVPPAAPSAPTVVIGVGGVTVSSTPTTSAGSVQAVTISAVPTPGSGPGFCTIAAPATECFIPGLASGTLYSFEAVAGNTTGTTSATTNARYAVPATPTISAITIDNSGGGGASGSMSVTVSADTGTSGGPASTIEIHISPVPSGANVPCVVTLPNSACTFTGLTPGIDYTVTTSAVNELGASTPSGTVEVPLTAPLAPGEPVVTIGDRQATVSVSPTTSGAPASSYTVTASANGHSTVTCTVTPPETGCVLSPLVNGVEYTITTGSTNAFGTSGPSEPVTRLVDLPPAPPRAPTVIVASNGVTVSSAPVLTAGSVEVVTISASPTPTSGPGFCMITAPDAECFIEGLTEGTRYTFEAVAANQVTTSSPASATATYASPSRPRITRFDFSGPTSGAFTILVAVEDTGAGGPVDYFTVYAGNQSCTVTPPDASCEIAGLPIGSLYEVTISATNGLGEMAALLGATLDLAPPSKPAMPLLSDLAPGGEGEATGSASVALFGDDVQIALLGEISPHTVTAIGSDGSVVTCSADAPEYRCSLEPLNLNVEYTVTMSATNVFGTSPSSDSVRIFLGPPAEPAAPAVQPGDGQATVTVAPGDGGGVPSSYAVVATDADGVEVASCTVTPPPNTCVLTPLTNGVQYSVSVSASNAFGTTSATVTTSVTPRIPPVAPPAPETTPVGPTTPVPTGPVPADPVTGRLPQLRPGEVTVITGGEATSVSMVVENATDLVIRNSDFEVRLVAGCAAACPITMDEAGRQVLQLEPEGTVRVSGRGFMPGSSVLVWVFSEPRMLGEVLVGEDGSFAASLPIGVLAPGMHTVQVNGLSIDNTVRTANLGVLVGRVTDDSIPGVLPATGADLSMQAASLMLLALGLLGLGVVLQIFGRRRLAMAQVGDHGGRSSDLWSSGLWLGACCGLAGCTCRSGDSNFLALPLANRLSDASAERRRL